MCDEIDFPRLRQHESTQKCGVKAKFCFFFYNNQVVELIALESNVYFKL